VAKYEESLQNTDWICTTDNHFCRIAVYLVARPEAEDV
jgi:hypothetical protein